MKFRLFPDCFETQKKEGFREETFLFLHIYDSNAPVSRGSILLPFIAFIIS